MCKAINDIREEAKAEGRVEGRAEVMVSALVTIMETLNLTFEQAFAVLKLPEYQYDVYCEMYREMVGAAQS